MFVQTLPKNTATSEVARQLARSGPSISSNYHAACRARSRAEFIAKLGVVVEEADETEHWLDVLKGSGLAAGDQFEWLIQEAGELRAIMKASVDTARNNHSRQVASSGEFMESPRSTRRSKSSNPQITKSPNQIKS
jgi:four helix bundle protein